MKSVVVGEGGGIVWRVGNDKKTIYNNQDNKEIKKMKTRSTKNHRSLNTQHKNETIETKRNTQRKNEINTNRQVKKVVHKNTNQQKNK